ncbi:hypothetical protein [Oryzibacter oryziterrae]|uniref:hypothetical protein n=1 Tax=Oryzibacter oryziterrae TaxID=2766474 RepID=UPI001F34E692|nr:hypothetical protein [Oryzibacter oryziterrae]
MRGFRMLLSAAGALAGALLAGQALAGVPSGVHHQTLWVPDYVGKKIYRYYIDQTVNPVKMTSTVINLASKNCNPNSVAVSSGKLYVACNSGFGGADKVLVYKTSNRAYVKTIAGLASDGHAYFAGSGLVGIAFDKHKNMWLSGYAANSLYRIPAAEVTAASYKVDRVVVNSPDQPAGLTVASDGGFWVVGQYSGGILLKFDDATLNVAGTFDYKNPLNPNPSYCLSNNIDGCNPVDGLFNAPEGVASFGGAIWVSNNGGNKPAKTLVRAVPGAGGSFTTGTYGGAFGKPFACPGGLFTASKTGATPQLWVNDEGYGVKGTDCGASEPFQLSGVGRVLAFKSADLMNSKAAPKPETFPGWDKLRTGSPGFGGIAVELD